MSKITEEVETLIQPVLEALNYELVEVEFVKEGKDHFLRVSIDKEGGVDLNDCTLASEKISEVMDEHDPIKEMYYLDVKLHQVQSDQSKKSKIIKRQSNSLSLCHFMHLSKIIKNG